MPPATGVARGAASEHREAERVWMRVKTGREGERKDEVHGAESSGEERSTPVSQSGAVEAYQGERMRVRAARWRDGAVGAIVTGDGSCPLAAAALSRPQAPAWRGHGRSRALLDWPRPWAEAPSRAGSPLPRAGCSGRKRSWAGRSHGPA
jgi:hypothetical protein